MSRVSALTALLLILTGCGEPAGTACQITGSGFHASDPCRHKCLSRWAISCPNGERITPNVCTGSFTCTPGSCPEGQVCYHDDDPFDDRSFCVPETVCGELSDNALRRWEVDTLHRQGVIRQDRLEKPSQI